MAANGILAVDYDGAPSVLIFGDSAAGLAEARAAAANLGARVAAALPISEAGNRLAARTAVDVVMLELAMDGGGALDALLGQIDLLAAEGRSAIVSMPTSLIDPVSARIGCADVQLLCEPDPAQRVAALGIAMSVRRARLSDRGVEDESERLARLSEEVGRIARTLAEMADREPRATVRGAHDPSLGYRAEEPAPVEAETVRRMIRMRRLRDHYFEPSLFADPAWDMLLDLMAARLEGQRVAVSSLCIAAAVPATTALRWIRAMTGRGLFLREADPHDARRVFIALSDTAAAAMAAFFDAARKLKADV